jgi:hypothetical protein
MTLLLGILCVIFYFSYTQKSISRNWNEPLKLHFYLINAEDDPEVEKYIANITANDFEPIHRFLKKEARKYQIKTKKLLDIDILPLPKVLPPRLPKTKASMSTFVWSLQLRYWAFKYLPPIELDVANVNMFAFYYKTKPGRELDESTGIQEGLIGIANLFGSQKQQEQNNIVIVHELLHILGATDKYSMYDFQPLFPNGYAKSDQQPLFPQIYAEIMAGRIPTTKTTAKIPTNLFFCMVGKKTASEINWIEKPYIPWHQQKLKEIHILYSELKDRFQ